MSRSATNNVTQSGSTAWSTQDAETYDPSDDIESYADLASGAVNVIIMDGKAWKQLKRFKNSGRHWIRAVAQTASSRSR